MNPVPDQRRATWRDVHGILLLDKPVGVSSNRALQRVRRLLRARKGGHTGALDPAASGLLPLCFGEATKVSGLLLDADKRYEVAATFGERRSTGDSEGTRVADGDVPALSDQAWRETLARFVGSMEQVPPMYSALKRDGQRLYEIARAGRTVERKPRPIAIRRIDWLGRDGATIRFDVTCSKGTYIRTLVEDIAAALGTVAYTSSLRRTGLGPFRAAQMVGLEELEERPDRITEYLAPADTALPDWPAAALPAEAEARFRQGQSVAAGAVGAPGESVRVYGPGEVFVGVGRIDDGGRIAPSRVFRSPEKD